MASFDYKPLSGRSVVAPADIEENVLPLVRDVIGGTAFSGGVATATYTPRGINGDSLNRAEFRIPNSRKQEPYALHMVQLSIGSPEVTARTVAVPFPLTGVPGNALLVGIRFHHRGSSAKTGTVLGWLEVDKVAQYFMTSTPSAYTALVGNTNLSLDSFVSTPFSVAPNAKNMLWMSITCTTTARDGTLTLVLKIPHVK